MDYELITLLALTFFLAGTIEGIAGLGLPTVSLGILSLVLDLETAMALLLVPSFTTNLWQAFSGGSIGILLRRRWPFLLPATVTVWLGAALFAQIQPHWLEAILGLLLLLYAIAGLTGFRPPLRNAYERPVGVLCGMVNGALNGLTGSFVFPGMMFLQALRHNRHQFVQSMGILFTLSTLALQGHGRLAPSLSLSSALGLLPALIDMLIGSHIRLLLIEAQFRRVFFACVLCLGLTIVNSTTW